MSSFKFLTQPFPFLDEIRHRWILIIFCTAFGIVFINVFVPFNINRWSNDSGLTEFLHLSGFGLIAGIVLLISQMLIRRVVQKKHFQIGSFMLWFLCELIMMAACFLFYQSPSFVASRFPRELLDSIKYTLPGILIPYSLALLLISLIYNRNRLNELRKDRSEVFSGQGMIDFPDEKGIVRFSVAGDHILYLEAADNYVIVYYLIDNRPAKQLLRSSMKNMEMLFSGFPVKRCHRSFMVNVQKIEFAEHGKSAGLIRISEVDRPIPVSRKFFSGFKPYLSRTIPV
ncbi:MAG: LytTR family DNA-binding domain-containing protein [Prolixibacteraceae bacterium]